MAFITKQEVQKLLDERPSNITPSQVISGLRQKGHQLEGLDKPSSFIGAPTRVPSRKTLPEKLEETGRRRLQKLGGIFNRTITGQQPLLETKTQLAGQIPGIFGDIGFDVTTSGAQAVAPQASEAVEFGFTTILEKAGVPQAAEKYTKFAEAHPREAANLEAIFELGTSVPAGGAAKAGITAIKPGVTGAAASSKGIFTRAAARGTESTVLRGGGEIGQDIFSKIRRAQGAVQEGIEKKAAIGALPEAEKAAVRVGVPENLIARPKNMKPELTPQLKEMAERTLQRLSDDTLPDAKVVLGEPVSNIAYDLSKKLKSTGKELGERRKTLTGSVDISDIRKSLEADFDELGFDIDKGRVVAQEGVPVNPDIQEVLQEIYQFAGADTMDLKNIDRLRATLGREFTKAGIPLQGPAKAFATKYRGLLLNKLDEFDPQLGELMRQYADQRGALDDFINLLGKKRVGNLENLTNKSLRVAEVSRRLSGRASDQVRTVLERLLAQAGDVGLDVKDIENMVRFADDLDSVTGTLEKGGFAGQAALGVESALGKLPVVGGALEAATKIGLPQATEKLEALIKYLDDLSN